MKSKILFLPMLSTFLIFAACVKPGAPIPSETVAPAPESSAGVDRTDVLIYGGPGAWRAEIDSLKQILYAHQATYDEASPDRLNHMSIEDFQKYNMIIFAGGDAPTVRRVLTTETHARLREAVQKDGLNYLGFCAGAWLAVAPAPVHPNEDVGYGLGVVDGPVLQQNYLFKMGRVHSLDDTIFPNGSHRKLLWYGGPITPEIPGGVIARYSDQTPAITQIQSGKGLVIISGLHPAANKSILSRINLFDTEAIDPDFAWQLLDGAIRHKPLPAF